jgi:hypothetical protein
MGGVFTPDDWELVGPHKWWWPMVQPTSIDALRNILKGPSPEPWLQAGTDRILQSLVMLHAAERASGHKDSARYKSDAFAHLAHAVDTLRTESGFTGAE